MRISDWSSDVCSSDLSDYKVDAVSSPKFTQPLRDTPQTIQVITKELFNQQGATTLTEALRNSPGVGTFYAGENGNTSRSEEHTSELQSLMRISYAVFCLKKNNHNIITTTTPVIHK